MPNKKHEIIYVDINNLIPYVNNSRTHSDEQIAQIAASIKEFNFTNPILLDQDNGIIAGHGRILAAQKLGLSEAPCIVLSDLTEAQKKAYIIADNQLAINADWDLDALRFEVEALIDLDFDIDLLGFNQLYLNNILSRDADFDIEKEWGDGMPEFDQEDATPFRSILVHFDNQQEVDDFAKLTASKLTDKTKFIYFGGRERRDLKSSRYSDEQ